MEKWKNSAGISISFAYGRSPLWLVFLLPFVLSMKFIYAQNEVKGTVYDYSGLTGLEKVQVISTAGDTIYTDREGRYAIVVSSKDSLSFLYFGKQTEKFSVTALPAHQDFDIRLQLKVDALRPVYFRPNSHRMDSLSNRNEYQKVFDYIPDISGRPTSGIGVGLSTDVFFSGRKIKQMEALQQRLEREEKEAYVDSRFTKSLVRRVTGLEPPALDTFMIHYRPTKEMLERFETDYDYYRYIRDASRVFEDNRAKKYP